MSEDEQEVDRLPGNIKDVLDQLSDDLEGVRDDAGFCPSTKESDDGIMYCPVSEIRCSHRGKPIDVMIEGVKKLDYICNYKPDTSNIPDEMMKKAKELWGKRNET